MMDKPYVKLSGVFSRALRQRVRSHAVYVAAAQRCGSKQCGSNCQRMTLRAGAAVTCTAASYCDVAVRCLALMQ